MIKDLIENERIEESFLVVGLNRGVTNSGSPYLTITLQDISGQIDGKKWEIQDEDNATFSPGNVIRVVADVIKHRNSLQLKVVDAWILDNVKIDVTHFIPSAPVPVAELEQRLFRIIDIIKNPEIQLIVSEVVNEDLDRIKTYPAASKNHHEIASGLLYHVVSMLDIAESIVRLYPMIDSDLLYAGVILHDLGKTRELSGPIIPKYTTEGRLLGHISIMQARIASLALMHQITSEIPVLLQHMVLSHHGKPEFGSPQMPQLREAEILNLIDNMDARIYMINKALDTVSEGEFTARTGPLEDRAFYKPKK